MNHHHKCPAWVGDQCNCQAAATEPVSLQEQINGANRAARARAIGAMCEPSHIEQMNRVADDQIAQQKLLDAAPEMLDLLRVFNQWIEDEDCYVTCPRCRLNGRHNTDCSFAALLARFPR